MALEAHTLYLQGVQADVDVDAPPAAKRQRKSGDLGEVAGPGAGSTGGDGAADGGGEVGALWEALVGTDK